MARTEYLLVDVILDRRPRMFWTAVTVAPHSDLKIQIKLIGRDDGRNYRICPDRPVGIVEGMDPIMPIAFSYMLD